VDDDKVNLVGLSLYCRD